MSPLVVLAVDLAVVAPWSLAVVLVVVRLAVVAPVLAESHVGVFRVLRLVVPVCSGPFLASLVRVHLVHCL